MSDDQTLDTPEDEIDPWPKHTVEELGAMSDFDRAKLGKDAWNKWALAKMKVMDENGVILKKGAEVNFTGQVFEECEFSFKEFMFPGIANFENAIFEHGIDFRMSKFFGYTKFIGAKFDSWCDFDGSTFFDHAIFRVQYFKNNASFMRVIFKKNAHFNNVIFEKIAAFQDTEFSGRTIFVGAIFKNMAKFEGAIFYKALSLENAIFTDIPDLRETKFITQFSFHNVNINFQESKDRVYKVWKKAKYFDHAVKFCRFKELAIQSKDHQREQDFFANELRAKRFYETNGLALIPNFLYGFLSDFGRSTIRPISALFLTWWLFGLIYFEMGRKWSVDAGVGFKFSASALFPFIPTSRENLLSAKSALFYGDLPWGIELLMFGEGILGFTFIFLIGLALRNRFRI